MLRVSFTSPLLCQNPSSSFPFALPNSSQTRPLGQLPLAPPAHSAHSARPLPCLPQRDSSVSESFVRGIGGSLQVFWSRSLPSPLRQLPLAPPQPTSPFQLERCLPLPRETPGSQGLASPLLGASVGAASLLVPASSQPSKRRAAGSSPSGPSQPSGTGGSSGWEPWSDSNVEMVVRAHVGHLPAPF